ncbi:MAG: methylenetetrahydrofolate reductase [Candidatus Dormibacteraeota bacterium]|nr:methylenetetrahydrofolate reductase [Candidatus Dormibacteraeota bacterium]
MITAALCSAELAMPRRADLARVQRAADQLAGCVTVVGLTDNHTARPRLSPLAAVGPCRERGLDAVVHLSLRDRTRLGLQQQVMGAAALGAVGVLVVRGDPGAERAAGSPTVAEALAAIPGWVAPQQLLRGSVVNPFADRRRELRLLERKAAAGLDFVQTQMVFDLAAFEDFLGDLAGLLAPTVSVFASVGVIRSARSLQFVRRALPDCPVPEPYAERIVAGGGAEVAMEIAGELGSRPELRLHVIPLGSESHAARICAEFRSRRLGLLAAAG